MLLAVGLFCLCPGHFPFEKNVRFDQPVAALKTELSKDYWGFLICITSLAFINSNVNTDISQILVYAAQYLFLVCYNVYKNFYRFPFLIFWTF